MFRTKKDVDKHVQDINAKIKNSSERALKGYAIAKLYYGVGDYEAARRHLAAYLLEKDTSSVAHKLSGQILEQLKQPDKALACYKKAQELDPSPDLVTKICGLMADLPVEPGRAKYWVEVGEKTVPHSDSVYRLREAMLAATEGENSPALEEVLLGEVKARPQEVGLRLRLASLYQRVGRIETGWAMVCEVESTLPWPQSRDWYSAVVEMAENYQVQFRSRCSAAFYQLYLSGLDRLAELQAAEGATASALADLLHRADQALHELALASPAPSPALLAHYRGQVALHCAALLAKRALKDPGSWREGAKLAGVLYLGAWSSECPRELEGRGSSRRAVAGHMLRCLQGEDMEWGERLAGQAGSSLGERLHRAVFCARDQRAAAATSWLAAVTTVAASSVPSLAEVAAFCPQFVTEHRRSLHQLTWLLARYYSPGKVLELVFPLPWAGAVTKESLAPLDADAFLYSLHYSTGWAREDEASSGQPPLPPCLAPALTSTVQEAWWGVACKAFSGCLQPQDRRVLQHGVEAIRCTGLHGLDINLTMKLGKTFERLSLGEDTLPEAVEGLERRAALYYRAALVSMDQQERGLGVREPSVRLLGPAGRLPGQAEVEKMRAPARLFLATQLMHAGQHLEALAAFRELKSAEAAFHSGEIHRKLALEERSVSGLMGEVTARYTASLQEARESFYLTLDRVRGLAQPSHPLDSILAEYIEEVEQLLAGAATGPPAMGLSVTGPATPLRSAARLQTSTPARCLFDQNTSVTRDEARPSPERLDAQMRQLTSELGRTTATLARTLSHVEEKEERGEGDMQVLVEQGREVVQSGQGLVKEVRECLVPLVREVLAEVRDLRREGSRQGDAIVQLLTKISEAAPAPSRQQQGELSEDERLLLDSFAYPGLQQQQLGLLQQQLLQQQLVQQQLARQQPLQQPFHHALAAPGLFPAMPPQITAQVVPAPALPPLVAKPPQAPANSAPANVVMQRNDPIPSPSSQGAGPALAVTVPPQHRLGGLTTPRQTPNPSTPPSHYKTPSELTPLHSYQMQMPAGASPLVNSPFGAEAGPAVVLTTQALLSTINTPVFSAVTPSPEKQVSSSSLVKSRMASGGPDTPRTSRTEEDGEPEEYEPEVVFTPVIPLPDKVEVVTGEEEEEILLEDRAKLFRWEGGSKEWKERGIGQAKILKRKDTGKVRFLMRREQTFKVCANHAIGSEMKLQPMAGQAKARVWGARDFADEELKDEKFCIRFKTEEQAAAFEAKFEEAVKLAEKASTSPVKKVEEIKKAGSSTLAQFALAQKSGKWSCSACLTSNPDTVLQCAACEGPKPGHEDEVAKMKEAAKVEVPVMTIGAGGGFKFGGGAPASTQASGFSFGSPATVASTAASSGFGFGSPATAAATTAASSGFGFGSSASTTVTQSSSGFGGTTTSSASGFSFGSKTTTTSSSFGFGGAATSATTASSTTSEAAKPTMGGFSFSGTPVVVKPKPVEEIVSKKPEEVVKPGPFSGFSFGGAGSSSSLAFGSKAETVSPAVTSDSTDTAPLFGIKTEATFGSVAAAGEAFKPDPNFKGFSGAGSGVFGVKKEVEEGEGGADEEYEPTGEFTPVIPLPELVEVKTGEEEETALFSERGKLFRFVQDTKEWKERGIGDFKILKHSSTGKVRFLMRREQVLKICCNHLLNCAVEVKAQGASDRAWTWSAPDFSEGEVKNELFALRFKTCETASNFKAVVDKCQAECSDSPVKAATATQQGAKVEETKKTGGGSTLAQFALAQKSGKWSCSACLTSNPDTVLQCAACEGPKPGHEDEVAKMKEAAKVEAPVMTIGAGGGFKFGGGAPASTQQSGFSFGSPAAATTTAASSSGFSFGSSTPAAAAGSGFSFASPAATTSNGTASTASPFGAAANKHQFSFSGVKSPEKATAGDDSVGEEAELYQEEEQDNLYFEPVIPLPDKVDVVTGEEEETVLYTHRAKLFRLVEGEWKERGVGDVKILKHEASNRVRLLMRRDQVLKICLNHGLSPALVSMFKEKDAKSWTWVAQDFSEGELTTMTFALRFKTAEIAADFKTAAEEAVEGAAGSPVKGAKEATPASEAAQGKGKSPVKEVKEATRSQGAEDGTDLFPASAFKPVEEVAKEVELSFEGQGLKLNNAADALSVAAKISSAATVHTLTLSGNTVGIEAAGAIGAALEQHPELRRAHWKDMFTGRMKTEIPPALVNLTRGLLTAQTRLVELDLSDNAFGPVGMEGLKTFLQSPSCYSLRELKLNNTGCGVTGGKMLAALLLSCYHKSKAVGHPLALRVFILGRSRQENEGGKALAEVFKLMGSLEEVVMPQNGIYHEGLAALADAFSSNPNLRILNMNDNTFTEKGARAMGIALKKLDKLEVLNLGDCLLKSAGCKLICRALKARHPGLRELVLDSNEIREKGALEAVDAMRGKAALQLLSLSGNQLGRPGLRRLEERMTSVGQEGKLGEVEDNEEPDSDEEDPDISDEEPEIQAPAVSSTKAAFSFTSSSAAASPAASLFGNSQAKPAAGIFGAAAAGSGGSLFGSSASSPFKPAGNLFSSPATPTPSSSIFSSAAKTEAPASIFSPAPATPSNIFARPPDSPASAGLFGKPATGAFGVTSPVSAATTPKQEVVIESSGPVFGSSTAQTDSFNFTALAAGAEGEQGFQTAQEGFRFSGAGSSLFATKTHHEEDEDGEVESSHDPYFEPIVPLPELVEVRTGEEEEEVLFKHRAKVYRYCGETKQWKERGVGDIKILRHRVSGVQRVLLRRDQVHKIAANHRITKEMELKPLASSETAWCWYAMDFSEGHEAEGSLEHLAVRFKTATAAGEFKNQFEACQEGTATAAVEEGEGGTVEETVPQHSQGDDDDEEYGEEEEDYDEAGETIMFHEPGVALSIKKDDSDDWLSQGEVDFRIVYDDDVYGARIIAEGPSAEGGEDYNVICNHLIAMQTVLNDSPLSWSALDFSTDPPTYRTFKVEFSSTDKAADFRDMFAEGKDLAEQSEILETVGDQDPANFYYGQGADGET